MLPPVFGGSKTSEGKAPHHRGRLSYSIRKQNASVQFCHLSSAVPETVLYRGLGRETNQGADEEDSCGGESSIPNPQR